MSHGVYIEAPDTPRIDPDALEAVRFVLGHGAHPEVRVAALNAIAALAQPPHATVHIGAVWPEKENPDNPLDSAVG